MDGPGPGSYDVPKAIKEAQWGNVSGPIKQSETLVCFTDRNSKLYKCNPGVGHYKHVDNHASVLQKDREYTRTHV